MVDSCEQLLALKVVAEASAAMASPSATSEEKVRAYGYILGIAWARGLIRAGSPDEISGLIRGGLSNPDADQFARQQHTGPQEVWTAV